MLGICHLQVATDGLAALSKQLEAELRSLPPRVRAHYARTLLAWTTAALLKSAGAAALAKPSPGGGPAANGSSGGDDVRCAADSLGALSGLAVSAALWDVLAALLRSPDIAADAGVNPALVEAAARACEPLQGACSGGAAEEQAEALAAALLRALRVLGAKFGATCRPSLEHRYWLTLLDCMSV